MNVEYRIGERFESCKSRGAAQLRPIAATVRFKR
jgi:hypothetical protein